MKSRQTVQKVSGRQQALDRQINPPWESQGLYKKALAGEISNSTSVSDPYEEPLNPEVVYETNKETLEESA